ncbi:MAG: RnfABCDGE type electron transport complex subunit G [Deltaproteobacteria bacterium]|nr:RnfABCDGE type electron transport complex subunit G [Deltaproteobacteria bacterium]
MTTAAHVEKESTIFGIAVNLMMAGLLSGVILATINHFTQPIREKNEEQMRAQAMKEVLPAALSFEAIEGFAEGSQWFRGLDADGKLMGYALPVNTRGYEGHIAMMLGVDTSFAIVDFRLIKHRETPGLGAKASEENFIKRFRGLQVGQLEVSKSPEPGKVLAITGATITSRAIATAFEKRLQQLATLAADDFKEIPAEIKAEGGKHE